MTTVIVKIIFCLCLTFVLFYVTLLFVHWTSVVPSSIGGMGMLLIAMAYLFGNVALTFRGKAKVWVYSLVSGFVVALGMIAIGVVLLLATIPLPIVGNAGNLLLAATGIAIFLIAYLRTSPEASTKRSPWLGQVATSSKSIPMSLSSIPSTKTMQRIIGFELVEVPRAHAFPEDEKEQFNDFHIKTLNIVRHLCSGGVPFALRIENNGARTRVQFLTWVKKGESIIGHRAALKDTLTANLRGFGFKELDQYEGIRLQENEAGVAVEITGIPAPRESDGDPADTLAPVVGVLRGLENGLIQVFVEPVLVKESELSSLRSKYKKVIQASETTVTRPESSLLHGERQESRRIVDPRKMETAKKIEYELERLRERQLCRTTVLTASWGNRIEEADINARRLAHALVGAVPKGLEQEPLSTKVIHRRKEVRRLLSGIPIGRATRLTQEEVMNYLLLPRLDMGIHVTARERFTTSTNEVPAPKAQAQKVETFTCDVQSSIRWKSRRRVIYYGNPIDEKGEVMTKKFLTSDLRYYDGHLLILGTTRSGKTWSALSIVGQAISLGVRPVVLIPSKAYEWRVLLRVFPDVRIFTAGKNVVSGFKFNFWEPPPNVPLRKWVDRVVQVLTLWLPNDRVISMHVEDWVYTIYANCGWDIQSGTHGRPIMFEDIVDGVSTFTKELRYDNEVNANFHGALTARVRSLLRKPSLVEMFNTSQGLSIPDLLSNPTIIEMDSLSQSDRVLLMGMLTAALSEYKLTNPSKSLANLLVLEEAHYILGKGTLEGEANSAARQQAVNTFVEMLRVLGGTGLGVVVIDQLPSALASEVVKLPVNAILHRLKDDRETLSMLGGHFRCNDAQLEHIQGMKRGEAVVYLEEAEMPMNLRMLPLKFLLKDEIDLMQLEDAEVRNGMKSFFDKHPHLVTAEPLPTGLLEKLATREGDASPHEGKGSTMTLGHGSEFMQLVGELLEEGSQSALKQLAVLIQGAVGDKGLPYAVELADHVIREHIPNEQGVVSKRVIANLLDLFG